MVTLPQQDSQGNPYIVWGPFDDPMTGTYGVMGLFQHAGECLVIDSESKRRAKIAAMFKEKPAPGDSDPSDSDSDDSVVAAADKKRKQTKPKDGDAKKKRLTSERPPAPPCLLSALALHGLGNGCTNSDCRYAHFNSKKGVLAAKLLLADVRTRGRGHMEQKVAMFRTLRHGLTALQRTPLDSVIAVTPAEARGATAAAATDPGADGEEAAESDAPAPAAATGQTGTRSRGRNSNK
jgi:hypothetical protein